MDFALPPDNDNRRIEFRTWLAEHPKPTPRQLAEGTWVAPHWPRPWGQGADPITQLIIDDELKKAGIYRPNNPIGIGWAGPTILYAGTQAQKERYLMPMLAAEEIWCQLFSEPGAGSDLAGLSTKAVADGDTWVVTGQKIWTSFAHVAQFGILLARTDPNAPKHKGISYFICPMDSPGITVRPIVDMTAMHTFNEVFLDEVRIPAENLVGEVNRGWELAKVTLGNERVSLSGEGSLWGGGPTANHLINAVKSVGGTNDPILRQQLAEAYIESEILRILRLRTVTAIISGRSPGAEASVRKALADDHGKRLMNLAKNMAQASGMLAGTGPLGANPAKKPVWGKVEKAPFEPPSSPNESRGDETSGANAGQEIMWSFGFLVSPALTIGGGTSEVQRNIVAERSLGLPHEIDPSDTK